MNNINITIGCQQAGRFRLQVGKTPDTVHTDTGWFDNVILDSGIAYLLNTPTANMLSYISVGTSNATPDVSQTGLIARVATTDSNGSTTHGYDSAGGYGWTRQSYQFAQGAAAGNLAEVGIGASTNGNNLWSRARILDGSGVPTVLTVTADAFLTVTYELRSKYIVPSPHTVYWDESDGGVSGSSLVTYNTPSYNNTSNGAAAIYRRSTAVIPRINPDGTGGWSATPAVGGVKGWWAEASISQSNPQVTGIARSGIISGGLLVGSPFCTFTPPIPKTNEYKVRVEGTYTISRWTP